MTIDFQVIPHRRQRYETVGDYYKERRFRDSWCFRVSRMKDRRYEVCVFLHEIIEFFLCRMAGVKVKDIDRFDREYEETREEKMPAPCNCAHYEEPGDDPHAPYYLQHQTATKCERLIAGAMGINWKEYDDAVNNL
jgi:hypothetical protein